MNSEHPIDVTNQESTEQVLVHHPNKRRSSKTLLLSLLILVLVVGLGGMSWLWYTQRMDAERKTADMQQQIADLQARLAQQGKKQKDTRYKTSQFSFVVPDGWTVTKQEQDSMDDGSIYDGYTIKNPDTGFEVQYFSGPGGLGGGCDPEDQVQQVALSSRVIENKKFAEKTYYNELIAPVKGGKYYAWFGISNQHDVNGKVCTNTSYMITSLTNATDSVFFFGGGLTHYKAEFASESEARAFFSTSDYKAAKQMILSLRSL